MIFGLNPWFLRQESQRSRRLRSSSGQPIRIRRLRCRMIRKIAYALVVVTCACAVSLLFLQVYFTQKPMPLEVPDSQLFNGRIATKKSEDMTTKKIKVDDIRLMERNARRRARVKRVCGKSRLNSSAQYLNIDKTPWKIHSIYVNDRHRLLYCEVPNVACTSWKRVLLTLSGKVESSQMENRSDDFIHSELTRLHLRRLETYNGKEIQRRLSTYFKFMFVREPFERLLSAYRNKLASADDEAFQKHYGRNIIRRFRKKTSNTSLERGHDVTIEEFVRYLLDPKTTSLVMFERHWRPYHQLCHPCHVDYDFIGKYETLDDDADFVLRRLRVKHLVDFPKRNSIRSRSSEELVAKQFANISRSDLHRLWEIYSMDFNLFAYPSPQ